MAGEGVEGVTWDAAEPEEEVVGGGEVVAGPKEKEAIPGVQKVSRFTKVNYSSGNVSRNAVLAVQSYFINPFLLEVAGLNPYLVGTILLIKQLADAFTDPFIGRFSDVTKSPFGRRIPYIVLATLPSGGMWVLTWYAPELLEDYVGAQVLYFIGIFVIFNVLNTCVTVPYFALIPNVVSTYKDRTFVAFCQNVFGMLSAMLLAYLTGLVIEKAETERMGYLYGACISGGLIVIFAYTSIITVKERDYKVLVAKREAEDEAGIVRPKSTIFTFAWEFLTALVSAILFKEFAMIATVFLLSLSAIYFTANNLIMFCKYVVEEPDAAPNVILVAQICAIISFFLWAFSSNTIGKKKTYYVGGFMWVASVGMLFFIKPHQLGLLYTGIAGRSIGAGVGYMIPYAMLPDAIEVDARVNGKSREGLLFSIFILFQKIGLAVGLVVSSFVLGFVGYEAPVTGEEDVQSEAVILTLRILTTLCPLVCVLVAIMVVYFYPLSKKRMMEIMELGKYESSSSSDSDYQEDDGYNSFVKDDANLLAKES